ncbi:fungal-specific transcription factor domain-containing protein [Phaeosphaeria sp. MPI-PUGE-AT-0046c]|nr:fungal-specific transcription factor domain-containing protein [Phaeosphaeria sp. MPI-PUGE-AT-0046c]
MASRRSANTCAECRTRKVRCDGQRDTCSPCERLRLSCSFERATGPAQATPDLEVILASRRARVACGACQSSKIKCSGEYPQCRRCSTRNFNCVYATPSRASTRSSNFRRPTTSPATVQAAGRIASPSASPVQTLLHTRAPFGATGHAHPPPVAFFQHIQPTPVYSLFHKASIMHRFEAGILHPGLTLALIGTTCGILDVEPSIQGCSSDCLAKAEAMVMEDFKAPSAVKIQILVCVIQAHCRRLHMAAAFMLLAVASRAAYALKLNHEAPNLSFLERESRRRLMWSLFMIDMTLAGGIRDFTMCHPDTIHVQLPCEEHNFEFDIQQTTDQLLPTGNGANTGSLGALAIFIRLRWLRHRILQMTKETISSQHDTVFQLPAKIEALAAELTQLEKSLAPRLQFSERNLQLQAYSPKLCSYILVHVWLKQCYCDLYRVVLVGLKEALRDDQIQCLGVHVISELRWKCFESARNLSDILGSVQSLKYRPMQLESDIHVCAYQCVRLLWQCFRQCIDDIRCITEDELQVLVQQCISAVNALPSNTPVRQRIAQDLMKLVSQGNSPRTSPRPGSSPVLEAQSIQTPSSTITGHLFSRHSLIGQMQISDDAADLTIRSLDHDRVQSPGPSNQTLDSDQVAGSTMNQQWQSLSTNFESFDGFAGGLSNIFDLEPNPVSLDIFGWEEGF